MKYIIVLFLSGCANVTMMDQLHVNNNASNNFVGNPCNFYVGEYCMWVKK